MEIFILAANVCLPKKESCHKKGISKSQVFGKGTRTNLPAFKKQLPPNPKGSHL